MVTCQTLLCLCAVCWEYFFWAVSQVYPKRVGPSCRREQRQRGRTLLVLRLCSLSRTVLQFEQTIIYIVGCSGQKGGSFRETEFTVVEVDALFSSAMVVYHVDGSPMKRNTITFCLLLTR